MPNALSLLARLCLLWLVPVAMLTARADDFLPAKSAYKVTTAVDAGRLVVRYEIAPGYYLYRDRLGFEVVTPGVTLAAPTLPVGIDHEDEYFGRQVIYRDVAVVGVPVTFAGAPRDFDLKLKLQGCADAGLCYPPQNWPVSIAWPQGTAQASQQGMDAAAVADGCPQPATAKPRFPRRRTPLRWMAPGTHRRRSNRVASTCASCSAAAPNRMRISCPPTGRSCSRPRVPPATVCGCGGTSRTTTTSIATR